MAEEIAKARSAKNLLVGIYYHPEAYPPTLNAIAELSVIAGRITVVYRPHIEDDWKYPGNVKAVPSGNRISSVEQERSSVLRKVGFFAGFVKDFIIACKREKPAVILLYDTMPLLAYYLAKPFLSFSHKLWYHNHDVAEISRIRKYSIGWFAIKAERALFSALDIFSLPAENRKPHFPMESFSGQYFFIPNYPSRLFYSRFRKLKPAVSPFRLVFQGRISEGHGLETIIPLLKENLLGLQLELVLKGYCDERYHSNLVQIAAVNGVAEQLRFTGFGPYREVPVVASECHVGIAIFSGSELMHLTLGTSSNKIYEYAALGLPIIYTDAPHFTSFLKNYEWAIPVKDNQDAIRSALLHIIQNYDNLSSQALRAFDTSLNFETHFEKVSNYITPLLK